MYTYFRLRGERRWRLRSRNRCPLAQLEGAGAARWKVVAAAVRATTTTAAVRIATAARAAAATAAAVAAAAALLLVLVRRLGGTGRTLGISIWRDTARYSAIYTNITILSIHIQI